MLGVIVHVGVCFIRFIKQDMQSVHMEVAICALGHNKPNDTTETSVANIIGGGDMQGALSRSCSS